MNAAQSPPYRRVAIVGVGLIGGSFGLALRHRFPSIEIIGVDRPGIIREAVRRKAINRGASLRNAAAEADLIVLAQPLSVIERSLPVIAARCRPDAVVTDAGSVKSSIVSLARRLFPKGNFIGGHPMTGSEFSGVGAAHPLLFENAVYILTPLAATPRRTVRTLSAFLESLGARVMLLDAAEHDRIAAAVSHLPQLTSVALVNTAGSSKEVQRRLTLAAGGFRDMTRIASSRYGMWNDILSANAANVRGSLRLLIKELQRYERLLAGQRLRNFEKEFSSARATRESIPQNMKGFLTQLSEVHVFMHDRPGELARLTALMARARLNIKDIELMKIRVGTGGTFRLSFATRDDAKRAALLLRKNDFEATA